VLLVVGHVFFSVNGVDWAFRDANCTVNALIGVDRQKVRAFAKTVYGADIDAVGVFAFDTGFGNGMGHSGFLSFFRETVILLAFTQSA
jgi:hypothetical protein